MGLIPQVTEIFIFFEISDADSVQSKIKVLETRDSIAELRGWIEFSGNKIKFHEHGEIFGYRYFRKENGNINLYHYSSLKSTLTKQMENVECFTLENFKNQSSYGKMLAEKLPENFSTMSVEEKEDALLVLQK